MPNSPIEICWQPLNHGPMPVLPLTHHEILELVAPLARQGRHVDLAASDRRARHVVFKPVEHPGAAGAPGIREVLELDSLGTGTCVLTRRVTRADSLPATLTAMGTDPGRLFAQVAAVPLEVHFHRGPGYSLSRSYSLEWVKGRSTKGASTMQPIMTQGVAQVDGLKVTLGVPSTRGVGADIQLTPPPGDALELPEDLLAVLGWDWARLIRGTDGWKTKHRLRGGPLARTRTAERALDAVAAHLARTLAEPTARFHDTWAAARWGVFLRRSIPVLTLVVLFVIIGAIPHVFGSRKPALLMLAFHVPTALIALSFCLQELPQYEIPPVPRPLRALHWRQPLRMDGAGPRVPASV